MTRRIVRSFCSEGVGRGTVPTLNDTWTWDGSNWSQRHPIASPRLPLYRSSCITPSFGRVVALVDAPGDVTQTWIWDGNNWSRARPSIELPSGLFGDAAASAAYDAMHQSIVVFRPQPGTPGFSTVGAGRATYPPPEVRRAVKDPRWHTILRAAKLSMFGGITDTSLGDTWTWGASGGHRPLRLIGLRCVPMPVRPPTQPLAT